ncbi:MAG: tRNA pseudouridine(38-40) synthase TruA [Lachnospiraceae bacterium]|nr:tRNA pseudouridine(38-40) synthase TruA [Lachnospiraceae bacterium]
MNYRMEIAYDGTRYNGWQKLGDSSNTIQEKIEKVLSSLAGEQVDVHGAGRTDAGVHAAAQTAQFRMPGELDRTVSAEMIRSYLNRYLPDDIGILSVEQTDPRFHSRYHAKGKIYTYRLTLDLSRHVFDRRYITRLDPDVSLDIEAMRSAASDLVGTHDFRSFCGNSHFKKSTVRTLYSVEVLSDGPDLTIIYRGDGFLQYMVRIMTGTLLEIGLGERPSDCISAILDAKNRRAAGKTAPPEGLTLTKVIY